MRAVVNEALCAGCGPCEEVCPEVYKIIDGISRVQLDPIPPELEDKARQGAEACPTEAITIEE